MRHYYFLFLLLAGLGFTVLPGCSSDDKEVIAPAVPGVEFSPTTAYQEAYPGSIVTFNVRLRSPEPVSSFGMRVKFAGATDYVALPEYPDVTAAAAAAFSSFQAFEYALPASATALSAEMKFKFIAKTATTTYEKEYVIKLLSMGTQQLRIWNSSTNNYFKRSSLDLLNSSTVPADFPVLTKDMTEQRSNILFDGVSYPILRGWTSTNGTRFKSITAAQYNALVTTYPTVYAGIAATSELQTLSTILPPSTGIGTLAANTYYIAKVNRNSVFSYVGIAVKKTPLITVVPFTSTGDLDLTNEYLQIEIKK